MAEGLRPPSHLRCRLHGAHDVLIARTPAQVAFERVPNLFLRRRRVRAQQIVRRQHHARRAEAALQSVFFPEGVLQSMQHAIGRESLDRRHRRAIGLYRKAGARLNRHAIQEHRARSALTRVAANLGAGQSDGVAKEVNEQQPGFDLTLNGAAVHADGNRNCHVPSRAE